MAELLRPLPNIGSSRIRVSLMKAGALVFIHVPVTPSRRAGWLSSGESVGTRRQPTCGGDRLQLAVRSNSEAADRVCAGVQHEQEASVLRQREIDRRAASARVRSPPIGVK